MADASGAQSIALPRERPDQGPRTISDCAHRPLVANILNVGHPRPWFSEHDEFRKMLLKPGWSWLVRPKRQGFWALDDRRVYAIGDIHGCHDLLVALLEAVREETSKDEHGPLLIFLGDYVDRGPDSRKVIDCLSQLGPQGVNARFLCGNHEEAMLGFLADFQAGKAWPGYGGRETLSSYGIKAPDNDADAAAWRETWNDFRGVIPQGHLRFLRSLEDRIELGRFLFVHAGVDPSRPLDRQKVRDLRWIREPFLSDPRLLDRIVVHGHTPVERPFSDRRRIGVDTWAYAKGILSAVELSAGQMRFLQVERQDQGIRTGWIAG